MNPMANPVNPTSTSAGPLGYLPGTGVYPLSKSWKIATDPNNVGKDQKWFAGEPVTGAIVLDTAVWLSALQGEWNDSAPEFWGRDDIVKPHPIFEGLPSRMIMDLRFYPDVIARVLIVGRPAGITGPSPGRCGAIEDSSNIQCRASFQIIRARRWL
jgi:hypothetical protein